MDRSEVLTENVCGKCGVEVRSGSDFCYNCGIKVRDEKPVSEVSTFSRNAPGLPVSNGNPKEPARSRVRRTALRKKSSEPVQVTWRPDENSQIRFVVVSVAAALMALILIAVAYYLR